MCGHYDNRCRQEVSFEFWMSSGPHNDVREIGIMEKPIFEGRRGEEFKQAAEKLFLLPRMHRSG
jgi:hypothetical protein